MTHPEMVLAFVVRREGEWVIDAISRHYSFRTLFVCAANGAPLTALVRDSDFLPFGDTSEAIGVNSSATMVSAVRYDSAAKAARKFVAEASSS
jgi:hypothetical protein